MPLLQRCNGFNNSFAVNFQSFCPSFFCFPFLLFLFSFFLIGLEYCTLKILEHFSFNSVRWGRSWYFRPSSRGGLANFTPIAGMGHLIQHGEFVFTFSETLYVLLFSWANKNLRFWRLSNDCQIARPALVSGPPNWKKPYNKHFTISLVFSDRTVNYGSSFFSIDLWRKREARRP